MNAIAQIQDWHRYAYIAMGILGVILAGIIAQPAIVPPPIHDIVGWAPFLLLMEGAVASGLPRIQTSTGPGAAPILSPPANVPVINEVQPHP